MGKHFEDTTTVGVSAWIGTEVPKLVYDCLLNNISLFDKYHLFISPEVQPVFEAMPYQVFKKIIFHPITTIQGKVIIEDMELTGNEFSDYLRLFPIEGLPEALYVDTDMYLYNKFLIKELFQLGLQYFFFPCKSFYFRYSNEAYLNMATVWMTKTGKEAFEEERERFREIVKQPHRYTATGPRLLSDLENPELPREIHEADLDVRVLNKGTFTIRKKGTSIGCHLCASMLEELGLEYHSIVDKGASLILKLN